jgi:CHAT domain-containing protein/Tfp pilus assembly protein PilF
MKQAKNNFCYSHRSYPLSVKAKVIRCFLAFLILTYGCREVSVAIASEQPAVWFDGISGQQRGKSRPSRTKPAAKDEVPTQNRRDQSKDQAPEPQITNPLETLKLASEVFQLSRNQTREGATEVIKRGKALFALYQSQNFKLGMASSLFACGGAYYFLGQNREALSDLLKASNYSEESGFDILLRPLLDASIGAAYVGLGETSKALETLNQALPMVRRLNNAPLLAMTLKGLGDVYLQLDQKRKAIEYLSEALSLYQQTGNWLQEVQVLPLISALRSSLGEATEAMKFARAAVSRAKEKGALDWEAYGYFAVGAAYAAVGNLEDAIAAYNRSLELLKGQDDAKGEATAFNNLGLIYVARGDFDRALDYFQKALKLSQSSNDPKLAAYASNNIGTIYSRRSDPLTAFRHFKEALEFAVLHKDRRLEAAVLASLADSYFVINSPNYSLKLLKEAAAAFAAIEDPGHESEALISLAYAYTALGRYQEALDVLRPVLESRSIAADSARQGYVLRGMGYIYNFMGDHTKALTYYTEALVKLEAAGDNNAKEDLYAAWGAASVANGDYQKAEELYTKGLSLAKTAGIRQSQPFFLAGLGLLREKQGNLAQAESLYDQGIVVSESLHSAAHIEELKTVVGSLSAEVFSPAILLKFKLGKWTEAFELAEKARARTFLDQMNNVRIDMHKGGDPELVNHEQALRFDMRSLEEKLRKEQRNNPSSEACRLMEASLKAKEEAYAALLIRLKASNPRYAQLQSYSPVSLNEIQRLLGSQTTLVSYFVTADKTLAFVIGSDSFQVVDIPVKDTDLRAAIYWFRDFTSLRNAEPESLKQLETWLIAPIRQYIKTSEVVIVPHSILHYVPFAALTDGRIYFGDDHTIYHLPSASTLPSLRRRIRPDGNRLLSLAQSQATGLPSLRYVDEESRSVAKLYNTQALPTGRATRAEFRKRASAYNVLHIAAHAELNTTSPLFSRIRLASDRDDSGALEVREIYGMDLARTNLVVLSACETQLGAQSKGDDIVGLNRAFLYAGASSVIASLWTVDDAATSVLMKAFYGHLKQGLNKAAALQAAQTATRKKYPHPYYWAAFVLTGDPGKNRRR